MVIVPDRALLEGLPTTPDTDGPYLMWPVAERHEQRAIADQ